MSVLWQLFSMVFGRMCGTFDNRAFEARVTVAIGQAKIPFLVYISEIQHIFLLQ
jgi:hypothetical protein